MIHSLLQIAQYLYIGPYIYRFPHFILWQSFALEHISWLLKHLWQWEYVMIEHERHVLMPLFYIFLHKGGMLCQKLKIQQMTWILGILCTKELSVLLRVSTLSFNLRSESENCIEISLKLEPSLLSSSVRDGRGDLDRLCFIQLNRCRFSSSAEPCAHKQ